MPSVAARSNGWHCLDGLGVSEIFYLPDLSIFLFKELFLKQFLKEIVHFFVEAFQKVCA